MGNNYNLNIWESLKAPYFISRSPSGQRSISKLGLSKHSIDRVFRKPFSGFSIAARITYGLNRIFTAKSFASRPFFTNLRRVKCLHKHTFKVLPYLDKQYCSRTSTKWFTKTYLLSTVRT